MESVAERAVIVVARVVLSNGCEGVATGANDTELVIVLLLLYFE